jgi:hypothetical protein
MDNKGLIEKAKYELRFIQQSNKNHLSLLTDKQNENQQVLDAKIIDTKKKYKRINDLIAAGPKYARNFFSLFGNVKLFYAVNDVTFCIFSEKYIEVWSVNNVESADDARLKSLIYLEDIDPINVVISLTDECDLDEAIAQSTEDLSDLKNYKKAVRQNLVMKNVASEWIDCNPDHDGPICSRHRFCIGTTQGEVVILELIVEYDQDIQLTCCKTQIEARKKVSTKDVTLACHFKPFHFIIVNANKDYIDLLMALDDISLDSKWVCPYSHFIKPAEDRRRRVHEISMDTSKSTQISSEDCTILQILFICSHTSTFGIRLCLGNNDDSIILWRDFKNFDEFPR